METFENIRSQLSPAHERLVAALLGKGMTFAGSVTNKAELIVTVKSVCGEVTVASSGQVELSSTNIDPYEPYDTGYHVWTLWPEDNASEVEQLASIITRITGDD